MQKLRATASPKCARRQQLSRSANVKEVITNELIESLKSSKGGWDRKTLAALGVGWPLVRGWKFRIIGKELDRSKLPPKQQSLF